MSFLSQLIYGDDGTPNDNDYNGNNSTNKNEAGKKSFSAKLSKKPTHESMTKRTSNEASEAANQEDGDGVDLATVSLMNALYGPSLKAPTATVSSQKIAYAFENPWLAHGRKRKRKREIPTITASKNSKSSDYKKTPLQKELKQLLMDRKQEWSHLRAKWKTRKVNLENEVDVGGAVAHRARSTLPSIRRPSSALTNKNDRLLFQAMPSSQRIGDGEREFDGDYNKSGLHRQQHEKLRVFEKKSDEGRLEGEQGAIIKRKKKHLITSENDEEDPIGAAQDECSSSEEEEEEEIFERLLSLHNEEKPELDSAAVERAIDEKAIARVKSSHYDTMNYWDTGRIAPRARQLEFLPCQSTTEPVKLATTEEVNNSRGATKSGKMWRCLRGERNVAININFLGDTDCSVLRPYDNTKNEVGAPDPDVLLQTHVHNSVCAHGSFIQQRQMVRVAARRVVESAGRVLEGRLEKRLLQAIWCDPQREKHRKLHTLLTQTEEAGSYLGVLFRHQWRNRQAISLVAQRLAIQSLNCTREAFVPQDHVGYSTERNDIVLRSRLERARLIRKHSTKKWPEPSIGLPTGLNNNEAPIDDLTKILVRPDFDYVHIPGRKAPVPMFPTSETSLLFGPSDRHVCYRHTGTLDEANYTLTMSWLINRLAVVHGAGGGDNQRESIQKLEKQLAIFVEHATAATKNNVYKLFHSKYPDLEIPLVQLYWAMIGLASFAASGCPQSSVLLDDPEDSRQQHGKGLEREIQDMEKSDFRFSEVLRMDEIANKIANFSLDRRLHNGLQAFSRIHVTFALAKIAKVLPPSAAEILSKPLDNHKRRTPFDVFRQLLQHLEDENMLVDDKSVPHWTSAGESNVNVGELEYALHQASEIFKASCISRDPVDVSNHGWHLGALAASLLLCSGNRLGSHALPFPSRFYIKRLNVEGAFFPSNTESQDVLLKGCSLRKTLPKFEELRRSTKQAFILLLRLSSWQKGSITGHLALSSFLEWKQAVALLGGRAWSDPEKLNDIRRMHLYHATQWALQDRSAKAIEYVDSVSVQEGNNSDRRLKKLATNIEKDPDEIDNWKRLAHALGPIGSRSDRMKRVTCDRNVCLECKLLKQGFVIDHDTLGSRKASGEWWGTDLVSWWYPHFLVLPLEFPCFSANDIRKIERSISSHLLECVGDIEDSDEGGACWVPKTASSNYEGDDVRWLLGLGGREEEKSNVSDNSSGLPIDDDLPEAFELSSRRDRRLIRPTSMDLDPVSAAIFYRLIITCHLFGVNHRGFVEAVAELARRSTCNRSKEKIRSCGEFRSLVQLSSQLGLDISRVLEYHRKKVVDIERKQVALAQSVCPEAQIEAVRSGFEHFGKNKRMNLVRSYDVLDGLSSLTVSVSHVVCSSC